MAKGPIADKSPSTNAIRRKRVSEDSLFEEVITAKAKLDQQVRET
jgi:hypothetical protein